VDSTTKEIISWCGFEKVWVGRSEDGKNRHAFCLEYKQTTPFMLITFLKPKLAKFVVHNFKVKWQDNMFKKCLENLTID
jgi:hypothetical protein